MRRDMFRRLSGAGVEGAGMGLYTKALIKWQLEGSVTDVRIEKQVERYKILVGYSLSQSNQVDSLETNSSTIDLTVFSLSCITCFVGGAAIITGSTREQFCLNAVCVRWQYTSTTPRGLHNLLNFMVGHTRVIHFRAPILFPDLQHCLTEMMIDDNHAFA
ncbi:hypothetical protein V6N12_021514 [Hibiscus sabdariffa]|uniref:Uncharacterized protein n=1 Tax=Hibiscus sabdariffa TaxID=183260 RepID=A0ABR2FSK9_9ROSI